jgi:hypothetical protein
MYQRLELIQMHKPEGGGLKMTPERRAEIAKAAAEKRWKK